MLYLGILLRTIAWEIAFQIAPRSCSVELREEPGYISVFAENKRVTEHQKITANHKNQIPQGNDFSAFLCMGGCKSLSPLEIVP